MTEVLFLFLFTSLFPISLTSYVVTGEVLMGRRRCTAEAACKHAAKLVAKLGLLTSSGEEGRF